MFTQLVSSQSGSHLRVQVDTHQFARLDNSIASVTVRALAPGTDDVRRLFTTPGVRIYADTASYGLPPIATIQALEQALDQWQTGTASWRRDWDPAGDECRVLLGELLDVADDEIALLPAVSVGVAAVAASLRPGDEIVVSEDEFNSLLLPLRVMARRIGACVRTVPFAELAEAVTASTTIVATSHVRANDGITQDLDAVSEAAREHDALLVVDATHSAGIVPLEIHRRSLGVVVAAAYKHLLCPRGVAFMRVAPEHRHRLEPVAAGWRSTSAPYESYFGADVEDLPESAARFDVSLAWHGWVGARESLRFLLQFEEEARRSWCVGLASRLADRLEVPESGSSILGVHVASDAHAAAALVAAGITVSMPLGLVRVSFHAYNDATEVDEIAALLRPLLA